ncbi:MAG: hypothetical protein ACRDD7_18195 [Peptostreptococcaceae bacterium]
MVKLIKNIKGYGESMELLHFTNLNLFKSISLDQETLILVSKDSKYTFHINFKDEIKGVDFYELAIATENSSGYINKSGTAQVIQNVILDTLDGKKVDDDAQKHRIKDKKNTDKNKSAKTSNSIKKFYNNIKRK